MKKKIITALASLFLWSIPIQYTSADEFSKTHAELQQEIEQLKIFIETGTHVPACAQDIGKNLITDYNTFTTLQNTLLDSKESLEGSNSYREKIQKIDAEIFNAVHAFTQTSLSCDRNSYLIAKNHLIIIESLRKKLFKNAQSSTEPNNINKPENDTTEKKYIIFSETKRITNTFFKKIRLIQKAFTHLTYKDISDEYPWRISEEKHENIKERGQKRAQSYADEFIETGQKYFFEDIFRSTTSIKKSLGSLPNGQSKSKNFSYSHDFYDIFSSTAKENITERVEKNTTQLENKRDEFYTTNIDISKIIEKENKEYSIKLQQIMRKEESNTLFDKNFTSETVDSLKPFHISLKTTTQLFNYNTENLEYVLNRQNVEVE